MKNKFRSVLALLLALALLTVFAPCMTASAKTYSLGDVTGDGKIASADARLVLRVAAKLEHLTEAREMAADVNRSGRVNSTDARIVLRVAAKLETLTVTKNDVFDDGLAENAKDPANAKAVDAFIDGLNSGRFAIVGTMTSDGETIPMTFMKYDGDVRMSAEVSGIAMDMAQLDGRSYLLSKEKECYLELTDSIMNTIGLNPSDLDLNFDTVVKGSLTWTERKLEGKTVECGVSESEDGLLELYTDSGKLVFIRMLDLQGVCTTTIEVDEFRADVTHKELEIPDGYTKMSYISFIAEIMGDTELDPDDPDEPYLPYDPDLPHFPYVDPFENVYTEPLTDGEPTPGAEDALKAFLDVLNGGQFRIVGTVVDRNETEIELDLFVSGKDVFARSEMEGIRMTTAMKNGNLYYLSESDRTYAKVTKASLAALGMFGVDVIDDMFDSEIVDLEPVSFEEMTWGRQSVHPETSALFDCWTCYAGDRIQEYYVVDGKVFTIKEYDEAGYLESILVIDSISSDISGADFDFEKTYRRVPLMTVIMKSI